MVRIFVAISSATAVLISVTLWVLSYAQPVLRFRQPHTFIVRYGCITAGHAYYVGYGGYGGPGPIDLGPIGTCWIPYLLVQDRSGIHHEFHWAVWIPLWIPTLLFSLVAWRSFLPIWNRRKRRKLGLCFNCGYNLRALTEPRCPECGTPFEKP